MREESAIRRDLFADGGHRGRNPYEELAVIHSNRLTIKTDNRTGQK